jgi:ATP-dependent RNA helicase DeaD
VKPGNIVGAIANEIGIESEFINQVNIQDGYTTVDLPEGMPKQIFNTFRKIRVAGRELNASKIEDVGFSDTESSPRSERRGSRGPARGRSGPRSGAKSSGRPERKPRDHKARPGKDKKRSRK